MSDQVLMPEADILRTLENKQEGLTSREIAAELSIGNVDASLKALKEAGAIESRNIGNTIVWYSLSNQERKKVLVVEDDKHINDLIKISIGSDYEIKESFEGRSALKQIREFKPNLVLLDLMLPGIDGLEICQTVKNDPEVRDTIIIIVSAADAIRNRLEGIKKGADYYIKKPFNPKELRSLVNIFLKKKGKRFDPLIDLPDEQRLTREIEQLIKEKDDADMTINNLKIVNLDQFSSEFGQKEGLSIVRLVSQIIQDKVKESESASGFVGYIHNGEFIIAGKKQETLNVVNEIMAEFERVLQFIYQDYPERSLDLGIRDIGNSSKGKVLSLQHGTIPVKSVSEKKEQLAESKGKDEKDIGSFTYEQLQQLVGSNNLDLTITRGPHGVAISVSKKGNDQ